MKVKVRIALAVDPYTGDWNSSGWGGHGKDPSDKEKMAFAAEPLREGEIRYWIEAEVDVIASPIIQGKVIVVDDQ